MLTGHAGAKQLEFEPVARSSGEFRLNSLAPSKSRRRSHAIMLDTATLDAEAALEAALSILMSCAARAEVAIGRR